jgi:6-phosphogluconolactonase (cycloisomerase 2 family)
MKLRSIAWLAAGCVAAVFGTAGCAGIIAGLTDDTIVYVMDNSAAGNAVHAWKLNSDGTLTGIGAFPTGGNGTGITETPLAGPNDGIDPLGSQGSIVVSPDEKYLIAVNAGSGTITIFRIAHSGGLTLVDTESTGGASPVSVATRSGLVYVVNVNDPGNNSPSTIVGFSIGSDGTLSPILGSNRQLSAPAARPSQISVTPDGTQVIVTERGTNVISAFDIGNSGTLGNPATVASPRPDPFGFGFVGISRMVVSEAAAGSLQGSSASSYNLTAGAPSVISSGVLNAQTASCWVTIAGNRRQAFVTNSGSNSVTNYDISSGGALTIQQQAVATGAATAPIDSGTGRGKFVQLLGGTGQIATYDINNNGDLVLIGTQSTGLPSLGTQGLAIRQ